MGLTIKVVAADAVGFGQSVEMTLTGRASTPNDSNPANDISPPITLTVTGGTPTGTGKDITVQLRDQTGAIQPIALTFAGVTVAGVSNAVPITSARPLPPNFEIAGTGTAYNITTTAQYIPPVTVCFSGSFTASDSILHFENETWVVLPSRLFPAGGPSFSTICADTRTLSPFVVATEINRSPTDNAGGDQVVDATSPSGALVTLVGSGADPDLDPLTFTWSGPCGSASTAKATLTCPIGVSTMTLTVNDGRGGTASATAVITVLGPMDIKNSILGDLTALRATVTNRQDGAKLDDAIDSLSDSLDLSLWIDESHLNSQLGDQVFDAEKKSAGKLQELLKGRRKTIADGVLQAFINRMARADRLLALIAIADAQRSNANPRAIALANDQVAKGDNQVARGLSKEAIDFYRNAWKQVN